jgi:hypothetical protein
MASAHLAECAALMQKMQALLDNVVITRSSSMPALSSAVEQRIEEVRTAVLAEVAALKRRPGVWVWVCGSVCGCACVRVCVCLVSVCL